MNKHIIAIAILTAFAAAPAWAGNPGNNGEGNGGCGVGQQTNGCGGGTTPPSTQPPVYNGGGAGGAGGSAGAIAGAAAGAAAGAIATGGNGYGGAGGQGGQGGQGGEGGRGGAGGNASVLGSGNSSNVNTLGQQQGQAQGQMQGQAAISNSGGNTLSNGSSSSSGATSSSGGNVMTGGTQSANQANSVTVNGDTVTYKAQDRDPVASAWAAPLTSANGTCMGSTSAGAQGVTIGVSFGTTWTDSGCDARYDAIALQQIGERAAARARLCLKPEIAEAFKRSGHPCAGEPAKAASVPTEAARPVAFSNYVN